MEEPVLRLAQIGAFFAAIAAITAGAAIAGHGVGRAGSGFELSGASWTVQLEAAPGGSGAPPPLWYPSGNCMNLTGWFEANSNVTCDFNWTEEHCTPLGGSSAACSELVGIVLDPPFSGIASFPPPEYCPTLGCLGGTMYLTFHGPPSVSPEILTGTLLLQAYYYT
jgi:hypothetical protein